MATLGEYIGAGSGTTKLLLHLNGNSTDSSGNGNNGTDSNITYSLANGKFGQGAGFNGSSSKIIINDSLSLRLTSIGTILVWFKIPSEKAYNPLIWKRITGNASGFEYGIDLSSTGNKLRGIISDHSSMNIITGATTLSTNVWYLAIFVWDGSLLHMYLNNKEDTAAVNQTINATTSTNSVGLGVGLDASPTYATISLDEVIIENRAWSAAEISKYYAMAKGRFGII